jgi:hypothetical protein
VSDDAAKDRRKRAQHAAAVRWSKDETATAAKKSGPRGVA